MAVAGTKADFIARKLWRYRQEMDLRFNTNLFKMMVMPGVRMLGSTNKSLKNGGPSRPKSGRNSEASALFLGRAQTSWSTSYWGILATSFWVWPGSPTTDLSVDPTASPRTKATSAAREQADQLAMHRERSPGSKESCGENAARTIMPQ
jgi:hypothetical protein